jgi:predicted dehydrogenase/threonine dehydrogenase-like Zn-dependent dehydrogenase
MKQIFSSNIGMITRDVPIPAPGPREVLVKVSHSLISTGTETNSLRPSNKNVVEHIAQGKAILEKVTQSFSTQGVKPTWDRIRNKLTPSETALLLNPIGYSNSGIVVAKGAEILDCNVGDPVACAGSGVAAHAEYVTVPINLYARIPESLSLAGAAFATVGSISLQGLRRANVQFGEVVVITGLGLLGLLAVQMAKSYGLIVIGIDIKEERTVLAKQLGADFTFLANDPDLEVKVSQATFGVGADAVLIYAQTKSSEPANQALRMCRQKGRVVVVGAVGMDLDRDAMYANELDFVISTSYGPGRYDQNYEVKGNDYPIGYVRWTENRNMQEVIRLLDEGRISAESLVNKTFSVDASTEAYDYLVNSSEDIVAVLFSYDDLPERSLDTRKLEVATRPLNKGKIGVGIIGAGGFASEHHIPNLLNLPEHYQLVAIANRTGAKAKMVGNKFNPNYVTTDYQDILGDKDIDLVVISTRHNLHGPITVEALRAGKHVLVEKPLAMNSQELEEIKAALDSSQTCLAVGFNRRYSPLSLRAKEIINKDSNPILINYRVNAGDIPSTHWTQDPIEGGGRIIGEGCHFLDLCNFFAGSPVRDIDVTHIPVNGRLIHSEDNFVATTSYENGSVAVVTYVTVGGRDLPKERIEIFSNGSSMVIDDFVSLEMYGNNQPGMKLPKVDKGQFRELEEFAKKIKGKDSLIPSIEEDFLATEATFKIMAALQGNTANG